MNIVQFRKSLVDAAYCKNLASDSVLESVIDPEVRLLAEDSRFGIWYYGSGQVLKGVAEFDALEQPFDSLYQSARLFMQELLGSADAAKLNERLSAVDSELANLVAGLNSLERVLLIKDTA